MILNPIAWLVAWAQAWYAGLWCKAVGSHRPDWTAAIMLGTPPRCQDCHRPIGDP